ncbi:MAG TPA: glycosyltransferase, partial [Thermoleophilia bacterium]|nr:glycosyltransferase [Thermoleophilia bacterium]
GQAEVCFVPYQKDPESVASYYQAADVYVHAARADTFPNTVLEALACGTPVVATSVGGIPEQVEEGVTGFLTPPGDARAMATRTEQLLSDNPLRQRFAAAAVQSARRRFNLDRQVNDYLAWYQELIVRNPSRAVAAAGRDSCHA